MLFKKKKKKKERTWFLWQKLLLINWQNVALDKQAEAKKLEDSNHYLTLPATKVEMEEKGYSTTGKSTQNQGACIITKDSLQISTLVCSTKLTQNGGNSIFFFHISIYFFKNFYFGIALKVYHRQLSLWHFFQAFSSECFQWFCVGLHLLKEASSLPFCWWIKGFGVLFSQQSLYIFENRCSHQ